jgi:membrane-associated phospholipid phosphatase
VSRFRASERLIVAYFLYVALVSLHYLDTWNAWIAAALIATAVWGFSRAPYHIRNLAPIVFTLAAYREMDWFSKPHDGHLERAWIGWDRWLLDDLHLRSAIEFAGPVLPLYFELCYALLYGIAPVSLVLLLIYAHRDRVDRFWVAYLAGTLGAYALFPYFPSDPPRTAFPGADMPHIVTVIREFNLAIVGGYGIHSSVFPSAHVSSAMSAAWALLATIPERRWIGWSMAAYGISVGIAAVYGRYHYAVDVAAGIALSVVAIAALWLRKK